MRTQQTRARGIVIIRLGMLPPEDLGKVTVLSEHVPRCREIDLDIDEALAEAELDGLEQGVVRSRFGINCRKLTRREISNRFQISFDQVCQVEKRALGKLREPLSLVLA